jgi:hypothetical protein
LASRFGTGVGVARWCKYWYLGLGSGLGAYAVLMIVRYTTALVYRISAGMVAKGLERQTTCKRHATRRREQRKMEWFFGRLPFRAPINVQFIVF